MSCYLFSDSQADNIHLVDAIAAEENSLHNEEEEEALLCNSVKMIREKLKIDGISLHWFYFVSFL